VRAALRAPARGLAVRALLVAACLGAQLAPAEAAAQAGPAQGEDELRDAARERYLRGRQLLQDGYAVEALQELAASYQLFPTWAASYGMAMCQEALGRPREALELYRQTLREGGADVPEAERVVIGERIAALERQVGAAVPPAAAGRLAVHTTPPGAAVRVDGEPAGTTPLLADLSAGPHRVEVELAGYEAATRRVDVVEGQTAAVEFALATAGGPPEARPGAIVVRSDVPAEATIDGGAAGPTPTSPIAVNAGEHVVRVEDRTGRVWTGTVDVPAGGTIAVDVGFGGEPDGVAPLWFWLAAGTAGALAVGGAATGGYVLTLEDEYYDPGTRPDRRSEIKSTGDPLRVVTDALLGAALACAAGALVLGFFTDFSGGTEAQADVRAVDGPGGTVAGPATDW
jgi:hypothetical protein